MIRRLFLWGLKGLLGLSLVGLAAAGVWRLWPADAIAVANLGQEGYVDMHVHLAGLGNGCTDCYVHPDLINNLRFPFFLRAMAVTEVELDSLGDSLVVDRLVKKLRAAASVRGAVVLAMDGVIDEAGQLDLDSTQLYVPNDYVADQAAAHDELFFGASINPYRADAIDRLEAAAARGAVLIKWIPAIQYIDPADPSITPFYQKMHELKLPLLSHAGQERSFANARDEFSDPRKLRLPLDLGLTVVAAHIGTTGIYDDKPSYEQLLPMFAQYPKLFADISSLTQINKLGYLRDALEQPDLASQLIYGSDWPLQMFPLVHPVYHWPSISLSRARAIADLQNPWDRDIALKQALGVPEAVFQRSAELLKLSPVPIDSAGQ
ncbi:MAG: amidohydrolase family protein [Lysobacterales bacterium]